MFHRTDRLAVLLAAILILGLTIFSDPTLREFSSAVSLVCVIGLIWRFIGSWHFMEPLAMALAAALGLNLATAALAQYLLARTADDMHAAGVATPDNTLGILLVLGARLFTLGVIMYWSNWLRFPETVER